MATRRWKGDAIPVAQVTTIAVTGTWAAADTATLTINGKDITVTIGTDVAIADVVAAVVAAVNGAALVSDESRNETGDNIPEFDEVTASGAASPITLTGDTKGRPFTVTASEVTAGSGALGSPATSTAATGPNHFDNADNWSGTTVPVDDDDVVFDSGDVDLTYALDQNGVTLTSIVRTMGYTGNVGLAETNTDAGTGTSAYREYRDQYLKLGNSGDATTTTITVGGKEGSGGGRFKLDSGTGQVVMNVLDTGQAEESGIPAMLWLGTHASNVINITKGSLGIAFFAGESATVATLRVGYRQNKSGDSDVVCGDGTTLTTIEQSGGTLEIDSNVTTITMTDGESQILGSSTVATLNVDGGSCRYQSTGTATTINVGGGGLVDFSRDMQSRTVTNCVLNERSSLRDPFKTVTFTNDIDVTRCSLSDLTELDLGTHFTLGRSAI